MTAGYELKESQYRKIGSVVYETARINLMDGKKDLVQSRLSKRIRLLGLAGFNEYLELIEKDGDEFTAMVNSLCTNTTTFFREQNHFDFLKDQFFAELQERNAHRIRIWSAGCSTGEEPFSIAMHFREHYPGLEKKDCLILATDISTKVLEKAREGAYPTDRLSGAPGHILRKYFNVESGDSGAVYTVKPELKSLVKFRRLNLFEKWPMTGGFDVIFCRNVMIYFDRETQQELIDRFHGALRPGGCLVIGHSESLIGVKHNFRFVKPTIYRREY